MILTQTLHKVIALHSFLVVCRIDGNTFIYCDVVDSHGIQESIIELPRCVWDTLVHPAAMSDKFTSFQVGYPFGNGVLRAYVIREYANQQLNRRKRELGLTELQSVPLRKLSESGRNVHEGVHTHATSNGSNKPST